MSKLKLLEYYRKMCQHSIVLDFQGAISHEILVAMAEMIKSKFLHQYGKAAFVKKIFFIFIELAQNISAYSAERTLADDSNNEVGVGIILLSEREGKITLTSGNLIHDAEIPDVVAHCNKINNMDRDQLRDFYKTRMKTPRPDGHIGAGLGLIAIARKSGGKISYDVSNLQDGTGFLVMSVQVDAGECQGITVDSPKILSAG